MVTSLLLRVALWVIQKIYLLPFNFSPRPTSYGRFLLMLTHNNLVLLDSAGWAEF
jgi:hypothetical protein